MRVKLKSNSPLAGAYDRLVLCEDALLNAERCFVRAVLSEWPDFPAASSCFELKMELLRRGGDLARKWVDRLDFLEDARLEASREYVQLRDGLITYFQQSDEQSEGKEDSP